MNIEEENTDENLPDKSEQTTEANKEQTVEVGKQTTKMLYMPRPFSEEEFNNILILQYLVSLNDAEFKTLLNCEKTEENINAYINGTKKPSKKLLNKVKDDYELIITDMQNFALEGKYTVALGIAERLAAFTQDDLEYIQYKEGNQPDLSSYVKIRFANISSMSWTLDFIENVEKANKIANNSSTVNMKNAEKIYNQLRGYELNLDDEQKSSVYFIISEVFRKAQLVPGVYREPEPCGKEIFCLQMVLENTDSLSMVDCCLDRLSYDDELLKNNTSLLINAYKRVLDRKTSLFPEDDYRINSQIAQLYQKDTTEKSVSYSKIPDGNIAKLRWAQYFYERAYKKAPKNRQKVTALEEIAKIHQFLGRKHEALDYAYKATQFMTSPEKYEKMLEIAEKDDRLNALNIIQKTLKKIKKEKLPQAMKSIVCQRAIDLAKTKYKDEKVISSVERLASNTILTPNKKIVRKSSTRE